METNNTTLNGLEAMYHKNGYGIFEPDGNGGQSLLAYIKNHGSEQGAKVAIMVKCVNDYDALQQENKRLKDALESVLWNYKVNEKHNQLVTLDETRAAINIIEKALNPSYIKEGTKQ